jgi:23S rRNA (cytosine1962-C5)-methyltransferase
MARARARVKLVKALERVVAQGHPWIYRDALAPFEHPPGTAVEVLDRKGRYLASGWTEAGPIGVRVLTRKSRPIGPDLIAERIEDALELRDALAGELAEGGGSDSYRLIHGEGDGLPGVVCDRYAEHAVLKFDGEGVGAWREAIVDRLWPELKRRGIANLLHRQGRGESKRVEALRGELPEGRVEVREHGMRMWVDLVHGQKTGAFLDHRPSRRRVRGLAKGRRVLNLFGYTGGFSIAAGLGEAVQVVTCDVSKPALEVAEASWVLNGLDPAQHRSAPREVREELSNIAERGEAFDLIVSDPPNFAPNQKSRDKAIAAYRALHTACVNALPEGALWLAASCSSHVDRAAFEETLRDAAQAAKTKRELRVLGRWGAGPDHPVPIGFPEGNYLTVVLMRVHRR